jgi:WhiB family transcriptional regulator, redox-sensing transcriptional regulator
MASVATEAPPMPWRPVDWMESALCAELPETEADRTFFPQRGGSSKAAKALCQTCPVKAECLDYALEGGDRFGIWGGTSERDRRRLRKLRVPEAA